MKITFLSLILLVIALRTKSQAINYLDQRPPGPVARLFAPGIVSSNLYEHSAPAFSPDGSTVVWTVIPGTRPSHLLEMRWNGSQWSAPVLPSFTDSTADDVYASFSMDGKYLYFGSRRNLPGGHEGNTGTRIWMVEHTKQGWGLPQLFDTTVSKGNCFAHSIAGNGDIYFSAGGNGPTNWNIQCARKEGAGYQLPAPVPYPVNSTGYEDGPFVAPDGSYLIFESDRPGGIAESIDLYITFRQNSGNWTLPLNMGPGVNSSFTDRFARVSPDGRYLFFGSNRRQEPGSVGADIYWIDARIIDELRKQKKAEINSTGGIQLLSALEKSDWTKVKSLLSGWITALPGDKTAWIDYLRVLRKTGEVAKAASLARKQAVAHPGDRNFQSELVLSLLAGNKHQEANLYIQKNIPAGAESRLVCIMIANHLFREENFATSAFYYEKALAISPDNYDYYRLATAYLQNKNPENAIHALEKAALHGYPKHYMAGDPALQSLKVYPAFQQLIAQQ